jgi:three-Cys-motif partner protein
LARREQWDTDPSDGLKRELVHHWVKEKHQRLQRYVSISRQARRKFNGNATYIDLYCGTGRASVIESGEVVDGGALVAAKEAAKLAPFGQIHIGDASAEHVHACHARLTAAGFTGVSTYAGTAEQTVRDVAARLSPYGLHLAFLDPYNLAALPFTVLQSLGSFSRMDLLIHMSLQDLQREAFGKKAYWRLDAFAPGWRDHVDLSAKQELQRREFLQYWLGKITSLGYNVRDTSERVSGDRNQPLYLLVFASKSPIADALWEKIRNIHPQGRLL